MVLLLLPVIEGTLWAFVFHDSLLWAKPSPPVGTLQVDQCKSMPIAEEPAWLTKCGWAVGVVFLREPS